MIGVAIFAILVFLFTSYQLGRDDFVFLRKNVSIEHIFNSIFLGLLVALITARIGFVAFHPTVKFLNPLVFLALPYFPGMSFLGGVIGAYLFAFLSFKRKKFPAERLFDMLTVSFFTAWACFICLRILFDFVLHTHAFLPDIIVGLLTLIIAIFFALRFRIGKLIDGSIASLGIFLFALCSLLWEFIFASQTKGQFLTPEFLATGIFGFIGITIFLKKLLFRKRALKK